MSKKFKKISKSSKASKQIPPVSSVSDLLFNSGNPYEQESDFFIDKLENHLNRKPGENKLFRANYFDFTFVTEGRGTLLLNNEVYKIGPNTFYHINPGHFRLLKIDKSVKGYKMVTNAQFLKKYYKGDPYKDFPFLIYDGAPPIKLDSNSANSFREFFSSMFKTYTSESGLYKYNIINNLVITILYKTKELLLGSSATQYKKYNYSAIVLRFMKLLDEEFRILIGEQSHKKLTVKEFANMLNISPNYLSMKVKNETGKSISLWINEKIISEAQALLLNSDLPIARISDKMGFDEPSYFVKYFKKKVGRTPKDYRKRANFNNS